MKTHRFFQKEFVPLAYFLLAAGLAAPARADALNCTLTGYREQTGLTAKVANDTLTIVWAGDNGAELRLQFGIDHGTPTIRELAIHPKGGAWRTLATNITPEFRVVSGIRRVSAQQIRPESLAAFGIKLTPELLASYKNRGKPGKEFEWLDIAAKNGDLTTRVRDILENIKWEAFWDAPLFIEGSGDTHGGVASAMPPPQGIIDQPGLPRKPGEVVRATASYQAVGCEVKTNGGRIEISFPGASAGPFAGRLQYDVYKGSNLIRQLLIAKTEERSVAFKYDGGLKGLPIQAGSHLVWHDLANRWQSYSFGGPSMERPATVKSSNRLIAAELAGGSIAAFPAPHSFYWARESEENLGYSWYRKDSDATFSFGLRQAENEEDKEYVQNFALYSARPGTWQRMPVYLYVSAETGKAALDSALAFTRGDHFKPLAGYKVMGAHYHTGLVKRLRESGGLDNRLNDIEALKAAGLDIFYPIDTGDGSPITADESFLKSLAAYYDAARRQSDKDFLVMPDNEDLSSGIHGGILAHSDLLLSKPLYWIPKRAAGQPLVQEDPKYGKVYNIGSPDDMMKVTELENALIYMPHPRSKGSTGFPDAIKDEAYFRHDNYRGMGYRWGMGIDASEIRLGEYRFQSTWDEVNNWVANSPAQLKYSIAISETMSSGERGKPPYDDTYAMSPVNYVKLDRVPTVDDMSPIINALKRGDYFVTSGEVLLSGYSVTGSGDRRTISVDVEWTFPLDFVEVVWGDGQKVDRQIISTADLPAFGKKHFEIPFNAVGKSWVRFAAWDVATNGAMVQPVKLQPAGR